MRPRESGPTNENQWVGPEAARPHPRRPAPRCHGVKAKTAPRATITPLVLPQTRSVAIHRRRRLLARLRWPGRRAGSDRRSRGITDSRHAVTPFRRRVLSLAGTKCDAPRRAPPSLACQQGIPSVQFSADTPIGYASVIVGQKRRITPRLTHDQAELRFQAQFCSRTGEMSGAPLALPGLWPLLTHDLDLRPPHFDPW